jgi:PAS domain S-box-containing protein
MLDIKFNLGNTQQSNDEIYDVIIVGGGPAGLTAAIYTTRYKLKTLMIEKALPGGQMTVTEYVENYPGFPDGISGADLTDRFTKQVLNKKKMAHHLHQSKEKKDPDFLLFVLYGGKKAKVNKEINFMLKLLKLYNELYHFKELESKFSKIDSSYKSILSGISDLIIALSERGRIIFINSNQVLKNLLGLSKEDVINKPIYKVLKLGKRELKRARHIVFKAIREKVSIINDLELFSIIRGESRWFSINATFDKEGGKYKGAKIIIRDITEKKKRPTA